MRKPVLILLSGCVIALLFLFYQVRYQVLSLEEEIAAVQRQIVDERETIHVLEAEWSYLTRPSRLQQLAERHSHLQPGNVKQIAHWAEIPLQPTEMAVEEGAKPLLQERPPMPLPALSAAPVEKASPEKNMAEKTLAEKTLSEKPAPVKTAPVIAKPARPAITATPASQKKAPAPRKAAARKESVWDALEEQGGR